MNNLYNLVNNFNFYFEVFRNIETNKTFVAGNDYSEKLRYFISLLEAIKGRPGNQEIIEKIKENYNSFLEILNDLSNDKVFYEKDNSYFSIDLKQEDITEIKRLYEEMLKDPIENINHLMNFIEKNLKIKIFSVSIKHETTKKGFNVYGIIFYNLKSKTHSPENSGEKGLISKNFRIIFGVILEYAKKLNIDFDKSIFHFAGTTEGEKDKDTNRRLKAYHMAHKGFLKMQYNDIDEKELSDAFKNNEIHPFLYRKNKDEMYISVSKDVNLTEILDGQDEQNEREEDENYEAREDAWEDFLENYLFSEEGLEEIEKKFINLMEEYNLDIKEFVKKLFPQRTIWNDFVHGFNRTFIVIEDEIDKLENLAYKAENRNIFIEDFSNNEELIDAIRKNSFQNNNELFRLISDDYNVPEVYSMLIEIEQDRGNDIITVCSRIIEASFDDAREGVKEEFSDEFYDDFMNGEI